MSKTSGVRLTAAERKEKALAYRKMGYSYEAIGNLCGCSNAMAYKIVKEYLPELAARHTASAEELRTLELEKLDQYEVTLNQQLLGMGPAQIKHAHKCLELLLKVQQQRAKLLGLVVPTQVLVPVPVGPEKGRVESVVSDPRLAEVVESATVWEPPRLALTEPVEQAKETG
ncbi:MAG: hypothetical protein ABGY75_16045 [Gemmataceae bacterium]